jgi:hypothetical protein
MPKINNPYKHQKHQEQLKRWLLMSRSVGKSTLSYGLLYVKNLEPLLEEDAKNK